MTAFPVFAAELEIRARGSGGGSLFGRFKYSQGPGRGLATISDRGKNSERANRRRRLWMADAGVREVNAGDGRRR